MSSGPWWHGLAPAEVTVECSGAAHSVRWEHGRLCALAHPDVEGEQALSALAGDRPACLELLGLWSRHEEDPRVLVAASRGPGDPLVAWTGPPSRWVGFAPLQGAPASRARARVRSLARTGPRLVAPGPPQRRTAEEPDPLVDLANLAGPLFDYLAGAVAAVWAERLLAGDDRVPPHAAALDTALFGRVLMAVRAWTGDPALEVTVETAGVGDPPSISREDDRVVAVLPFSWLSRVWARGLAVVLGHFVLAISEDAAGVLRLDAAGSLGTRTVITIDVGAAAAG